MLEPNRIEDLAGKLAGLLPPGLKTLRAELEDNFRAVLRANLEKLDLVSRERFDVQAELAGTIAAWIAENLRGHRRKSEADT